MIVQLDSNEVAIAHHVSSRWATNTWGGTYGSGIINTKSDPRKCERIGIYGQIALGKILGRHVDLTYQEGGDEYDDKISAAGYEFSLDIKLTARRTSIGSVRCISDRGRVQPMKDLYIFGYLQGESPSSAEVGFHGTYWSKHFTPDMRVLAKYGHYNYSVPSWEMKPVERMAGWARMHCHSQYFVTFESQKRNLPSAQVP